MKLKDLLRLNNSELLIIIKDGKKYITVFIKDMFMIKNISTY